jgi:hypothetical protein
MMARNTIVPFKGRIQKRKTKHLHIVIFGLQRAAGPYRRATTGLSSASTLIALRQSRPSPDVPCFRPNLALTAVMAVRQDVAYGTGPA